MFLILLLQIAQILERKEPDIWDEFYKSVFHDFSSPKNSIIIQNQNYHVFNAMFTELKSSAIAITNCPYILVSFSVFKNCSNGSTIKIKSNSNITIYRCCFVGSTSTKNSPGIVLSVEPYDKPVKEVSRLNLQDNNIIHCGYIKNFENSDLIIIKNYWKIECVLLNISRNKCKETPAFNLIGTYSVIEYTNIIRNTALSSQIIKQSIADFGTANPKFSKCNFIGNKCKNGYLFNVEQIETQYIFVDNPGLEFKSKNSIITGTKNVVMPYNISAFNTAACFIELIDDKEQEETKQKAELTQSYPYVFGVYRKNQLIS